MTSNQQSRILFPPIFSTNILIFFNWEKADDEEQQRIKLLFDLLRLFVKIRNSFFVKSWWAASKLIGDNCGNTGCGVFKGGIQN